MGPNVNSLTPLAAVLLLAVAACQAAVICAIEGFRTRTCSTSTSTDRGATTGAGASSAPITRKKPILTSPLEFLFQIE